MRNYRSEGKIWNYTNGGGSTITSGTGVVINTVVGVAVTDIAVGETGAVRVDGEFEFACPTAEDIGQGVALNFDAAAQEFQLAAGDLAGAGTSTVAAGVGVTKVTVVLNPATA